MKAFQPISVLSFEKEFEKKFEKKFLNFIRPKLLQAAENLEQIQ